MSDITIDSALPKDAKRILKYLKYATVSSAISTNEQYIYFLNPSTNLKVRIGNRSDTFVIDKELIIDGFLQDLGNEEGQDVGWEYIGGAI
jgi:hypothetical protein